MIYRRDIDGLRAVAVGSVVVFHVAQSYMPGGYVGVDVFFVISGYLICGNIIHDLKKGSFTLRSFYLRRVRRIFPALCGMFLGTFLLVACLATPPETAEFGLALIFALFSITNVYFWSKTNYFDQAAEEMPLLHTWSLSIEEQFYLIFPMMLILLYKRQAGLLGAILMVMLVSLFASIVGSYMFPSAAFYLLPTRAWELLFGAALAMMGQGKLSQRMAEGITLVGLGLISAPVFLYSIHTTFPGVAALIPCVGAAFILKVGEDKATVISRILSIRPLVFLGLISYSLYLWHWPLMVFQRTDFLFGWEDSKLFGRLSVLLCSIAVATLSWRFIEIPTRNPSMFGTRRLVSAVLAASIALCALAVVLYGSGGLRMRFGPEANAVADFQDYDESRMLREGECFLPYTRLAETFDESKCLQNTRPFSMVVIGDSHAAALHHGLQSLLSADTDVGQLTGVRCAPTLARQPNEGSSCRELIRLGLELLPQQRPGTIVIAAARWNAGQVKPSAGWNADWLKDLDTTFKKLQERGIKAVLIGPMPEYKIDLPRLLAKQISSGDLTLTQRFVSEESFEIDRRMSAFANQSNIMYISMVNMLCPKGNCLLYAKPGVPLYFDRSHLTREGSELVAREILKFLRPS